MTLRVLMVNSGILGHASLAGLLREAMERAGVAADHIDLARDLTPGERVVRRVLCAGPSSGAAFPGAALLLPRARRELHAGVQAARRIRALERRGARWDVIHFHPQATAYASLARMRRTPAVVSLDATHHLAGRGAAYPGARLDYGAAAALDRRVFGAAAAIVPVSRWAAEDLAARHPECADRLQVLPYPVRLAAFDPGWAAERAARDPARPVRVLFMGGDFPRKGGEVLLGAWRAAGLAGRARLTLVTDWPVGPLPAGVDLRRGVRAGTPEWSALWREADLFVLPSREEAFGMVLQEAAAAGLPAVATRIAAIPEIVRDGETGLLVPPDDQGALAAALTRLADDAPLRSRMGAAARASIASTASLEEYGARLAGILAAAAGRA